MPPTNGARNARKAGITSVPGVTTITSGGQTGVDQGALRAALAAGLSVGGWCPPGRVCESGKIPEIFPLRETPDERSENAPDVPRSQRTEWNVRDSDATLILRPSKLTRADTGTKWTIDCAARFHKPILICDPRDSREVAKALSWILQHGIETLNVGGPSERTSPGIGELTEQFVARLLIGDRREALASETEPPKKPEINVDGSPWWIAVPVKLFQVVGGLRFLYGATALLVAILLTAFIAVRFLNFSVVDGKINLGGVHELGAHATVDAIAAFQTSGVQVRKGQRLRLLPDGRVSVATDHQIHLAQAVKGYIVQRSPQERWSAALRRRYPEIPLTEDNVFYRDWVGPEGEDVASDFLDACKLRQDLGWGALMFVILPNEPSARTDPFEVLDGAHLTPDDLVPLPHSMAFTVTRDGWLAFIINEAILSPRSKSEDSRLFYSVLKKASEELASDVRHQIPLRSIPLIWYADNAGAFRIAVQPE